MSTILALVVVAALSIVQSLMGVGLLVFGTPIFLLLGRPFDETLALLLPASVTISALQRAGGVALPVKERTDFATWALLPTGVGLSLVLLGGVRPNFSLVVAGVLAVVSVLRLSRSARALLQAAVRRRPEVALIAIGVVHGFSNLGGAFLTAFASARSEDKDVVRGYIAHGYLRLALLQLAVMAWLDRTVLGAGSAVAAVVAAATYALLGRRAFGVLSQRVFDQAMTGLLVTAAALLSLRAFRLLP